MNNWDKRKIYLLHRDRQRQAAVERGKTEKERERKIERQDKRKREREDISDDRYRKWWKRSKERNFEVEKETGS